MKYFGSIFIAGFLTFGLTACAVGPDYASPKTVADDGSFINVQDDGIGYKSMAHWWTRLNDPTLNHYIDALMANNYSIKEAAEHVIQAQESVRVKQADYIPSLAVGGSGSRGFAPNLLKQRTYSTALSTDLTLSWQLDLFGRVRRSVESSTALLDASRQDKEALEQSLIAELVRSRVSLAVQMKLVKLAQESALTQNKIYDLVKRRYKLGVKGITNTDVLLAEEAYRSATADQHAAQRQLSAELYSFDTLLGKRPGSTQPSEETFSLLALPRSQAWCLPASLLDRRPDLRASELRLVAANADIGVAIADLYPNVSLGGVVSYAGDGASALFTSNQMSGSLLSSITTRIFEGGALRANIRLQESVARELSATYAKTVLAAVGEAETALMSEKKIGSELADKKKSYKALLIAERNAKQRYQAGVVTLRSYLNVKAQRYSAQQAWLLKVEEKWNSLIDLYLSMGGDWFSTKGDKALSHKCVAPKNKESKL